MRRSLLSIVEAAVGLACQGLGGALLWLAEPAGAPLVVAVLWVVGGLLFADGCRRRDDPHPREAGRARVGSLSFWTFLLLALFLPVYGPIGGLVMLWLRGRRRSDATGLIDEYVDYIASEESDPDEVDDAGSGSVEEMVFRELSIQSYTDIVRGPNRNLKKALISKILQEWTPGAVPLLRIALRDEVYEIRSYASTALTTIEDRMNRSIQEVRRELALTPDDAPTRFKLARGYLNYAESGLLDENSRRHYATLAAETVTAVDPADADVAIERLAIEMRAARLTGDDEVEADRCRRILDLRSDHQEALGRLCELQFERGEFGRLSETCRRFLAVTPPDHPAAPGARLWAGEPPQEAAR